MSWIKKTVKKAGGVLGATVGGLIGGAPGAAIGAQIGGSMQSLYQQKDAQKQAQAAQEAQVRATEYAAAVEQGVSGMTSSTPMMQTADVNSQLSAQAAESAKKRRFSMSRTINNGGLLGAMTGKQTLG